ncbi:RWD domain-containing protein [Cryomyces antarcticus]
MAEAGTEDEREIELSSITAIFPELVLDPANPFVASIDLPVTPASPLAVVFPLSVDAAPPNLLLTPPNSDDGQKGQSSTIQHLPQDAHPLSYLPPLHLQITLPEGYPAEVAPHFEISTSPKWLPEYALQRLKDEGTKLWEDYGRSSVVFAYIDLLQQAAERGFDLAEENEGLLEVPQEMKIPLLDFDIKAKRAKFEQGTYDCGVCLEPKKGSACYQLARCGHVFCVACLQDFYNNCITEGDVGSVKCLAPDCGKTASNKRKRKSEKTLNPSELLQIPLEQATVQRYVDLKRKKKLESDKSTVYCPRQWCQGPARSKKYPKIINIADYVDSESEDDESAPAQTFTKDAPDNELPPIHERLCICDSCAFAFCRVCLSGWHGEFARCWPRNVSELSGDDKLSYDFIRLHTSPCPTCNSPCQKTHGCNHMNCFVCNTHFCYLCSAWLDPQNPYQHFGNFKSECYQRLWELEEGDEGLGNVQFAGARAAEAAAIAAAAEEDQLAWQELGAAAAPPPPPAPAPPRAAVNPPLVVAMAQMNIARPPAPAQGAAQRAPAGDAQARHAARRPVALRQAEQRPERRGLQRFLDMANRDEEDEWDSDELDDLDDGGHFAGVWDRNRW